jgi:hypothetical protein
MNFPDVIIYLGGGVAAQGKNLPEMILNSAKNLKELRAPYYGDSKEDSLIALYQADADWWRR